VCVCVCVDIQYAAAVSIHNVIHIFRGPHTPKTRVSLRRVHINARVGEFVDAAGGKESDERAGVRRMVGRARAEETYVEWRVSCTVFVVTLTRFSATNSLGIPFPPRRT
jgi:hypothetical protein